MTDRTKREQELETVAESEQMAKARKILAKTMDKARENLANERTEDLKSLKSNDPDLRPGLTSLKRGIIENIAADLGYAHRVSDGILLPDTDTSILAEQIFLQIIDEMIKERSGMATKEEAID